MEQLICALCGGNAGITLKQKAFTDLKYLRRLREGSCVKKTSFGNFAAKTKTLAQILPLI